MADEGQVAVVPEVHIYHRVGSVADDFRTPDRKMVAEDSPGLDPNDRVEAENSRNGAMEVEGEKKREEVEGDSA